MNTKALKTLISEMNAETEKILSVVYSEPKSQKNRILSAIDSFEKLFGEGREV